MKNMITIKALMYRIIQFSLLMCMFTATVFFYIFSNTDYNIVMYFMLYVVLIINIMFYLLFGKDDTKKKIDVKEGDILYLYKKEKNPFYNSIYLVIVTNVKDGFVRYVNTYNEFESEEIEYIFSPMWYGFKQWKTFNEDNVDEILIRRANEDANKLIRIYENLK